VIADPRVAPGRRFTEIDRLDVSDQIANGARQNGKAGPIPA